MFVTEAEARTKWCPEARVLATVGEKGGVGTYNRNDEHPLCLGTGCMQWRWGETSPLRKRHAYSFGNNSDWFDPKNFRENGIDEPPRPADLPASYEWHRGDSDSLPAWYEPESEAGVRRRGFCGLAGKPEFDR